MQKNLRSMEIKQRLERKRKKKMEDQELDAPNQESAVSNVEQETTTAVVENTDLNDQEAAPDQGSVQTQSPA